jgi:hypothetical protein
MAQDFLWTIAAQFESMPIGERMAKCRGLNFVYAAAAALIYDLNTHLRVPYYAMGEGSPSSIPKELQ